MNCLAMISALTACTHEDVTMFYRHVSAIYINSLLSLSHSLILYSIEMMSLCHPAMFLCAFDSLYTFSFLCSVRTFVVLH